MITTPLPLTVLLLVIAVIFVLAMIYLSRNLGLILGDVTVGRAMMAGMWVIFLLGMALLYLLLTRWYPLN